MELVNTFEGGTNGVTITAGNSGGVSGNAWDVVSIVADHDLVFSNAPVMSQSRCAKITPGATVGTTYMEWSSSLGTVGPTLYTRFYVHFPDTLPLGESNPNPRVLRFLSGGSTRCALHFVGTVDPGKFSWSDAAGVSGYDSGGGSVTVMAAQQTYRFEARWTLSATVGQVDIKCFLGDSLDPLETLSSPATQNFGGPSADAFRITYLGNNADLPVMGVDGVAVSSTGYLGPVPLSAPAGFTPRYAGRGAGW